MRMKRSLRKLTVRFKLVAAFVAVLILMGSVSGAQMIVFSGYIQDYNDMLGGISRANTINGLLKEGLDKEIREIVDGREKFEEGTQYEIIQRMDEQLQEIRVGEADPAMISRLESMANIMESLRMKVDALGGQIEARASVDEQSATMDYILIITATAEETVQGIIHQKLIASELSKAQIMTDFKKGIWIYGGVFCIVIVLSCLTAWGISGSVANPLRRLSRSSMQLEEGNLSVERVMVRNNDEIGQLCSSFNSMFDNLRTIVVSIHESNTLVTRSGRASNRA
jgi:methyl-accepting chemotaxis protein